MEGLGFELKQEASLKTLTNDVITSSALEGESLETEEVRSSVARHLGIAVAGLVPASRRVDGVVEMMLDATQGYSRPLTRERLCGWHATLFPTGRSGFWIALDGRYQTPKKHLATCSLKRSFGTRSTKTLSMNDNELLSTACWKMISRDISILPNMRG
jgi:hypothetical protein